MNAGKSTTLLQSEYNYRERGMHTMILTPQLDTRYGEGSVTSRIGLSQDAYAFNQSENLFEVVKATIKKQPLHCILVDEAQFLTRKQVFELGEVADRLDVPVLCYGLRTDFQGNLFEGSQHLLAWSDNLVEIKTICHCGKKATMVLRLDGAGRVIKQGEQIKIGGNDQYVAVCRKHFKERQTQRQADELPFPE